MSRMDVNPYQAPREAAYPTTWIGALAAKRCRVSTLLFVLAGLILFFIAAMGMAAQVRLAVQRASCENGLRQQVAQ